MFQRIRLSLCALPLYTLCLCGSLQAASPSLGAILPRGWQRDDRMGTQLVFQASPFEAQ